MHLGNTHKARQYAGFFSRMLAGLVDNIFLSTVMYGILMFDRMVLDVNNYPDELLFLDEYFAFRVFFFLVAAITISMFYFSLFHSSRFQATPGKMMLGIYVATPLGKRISLARAIKRYFASLLSLAIGLGGYLLIFLTIHNTAMHDWVAGTVVIKGKPEVKPVRLIDF